MENTAEPPLLDDSWSTFTKGDIQVSPLISDAINNIDSLVNSTTNMLREDLEYRAVLTPTDLFSALRWEEIKNIQLAIRPVFIKRNININTMYPIENLVRTIGKTSLYSAHKKLTFALVYYASPTLTLDEIKKEEFMQDIAFLVGSLFHLWLIIDPMLDIPAMELNDNNAKSQLTVPKCSYDWLNRAPGALEALFIKMKGVWIADNTTLEQFSDVFSKKPLSDITPIRWINNSVSDLIYFIKVLKESQSVDIYATTQDYIKMTACFVRPDGSNFSGSFRQIYQNFKDEHPGKKRSAIDDLVNNL